MADSASFENESLINNGDGITFKYVMTVIESSFFAVTYALQSEVNEVKLYRKNVISCLIQTIWDYLHIIPFLVHGEFLTFFRGFPQQYSYLIHLIDGNLMR